MSNVCCDKLKMYAVECQMYAVKFQMYVVECQMYAVKCKMYAVEYKIYAVKCKMYAVKCCYFLLCAPNRTCQCFPACNWSICAVFSSILRSKTGSNDILGFTVVFRIPRNSLPVRTAQINQLKAGKCFHFLFREQNRKNDDILPPSKVSCCVGNLKKNSFLSEHTFFHSIHFKFITAYILNLQHTFY